MSTDRQDLSPVAQRDAIAAYATANGLDVVRSYDDEGRSGLQLANRPALRQLLSDVVARPPFSRILVYDVSRWGRFQDADASAYYEYHCRLHGVEVIYVGESFANDQTPTTVLLKNMRRVMAAEYSRDIAVKARAGQERVVSMGYHMGPLPALGYRRCSVSADGTRRAILEHGQRKLALTDRIEWILGPEPEVALVRRVGAAYAAGVQLENLVALVNAERWKTNKGRTLSTQGLRRLLTNEALIGNFVWGGKSKGGKVMTSRPTRRNCSVPRIFDDSTWSAIQDRVQKAAQHQLRRREGAQQLATRPVADGRRPTQLSLPMMGTSDRGFRATLGSAQQLREHSAELGKALCEALNSNGLATAFDPRSRVLSFWDSQIHIRLMWPESVDYWSLEWRGNRSSKSETLLIARMAALYRPLDFFVLPTRSAQIFFSKPISRAVPRPLRRYWCAPGEPTLSRLIGLQPQPEVQ